jgi:hypothetical protein
MTSINFYERTALIKRIENNLNQTNHRYFEVNHGILSVTDNGDYVTVCSRTGNRHFGVQNIFDALNNFSLDGFDDQDYYDIWDYLDFCKYTLPEDQNSDNELKTDDELSLSKKRQVALVDMLLSEPVPVLITESSSLDDWTISLIPQSPTFQLNTEVSTLNELVEEPEQKNEILWEKNRELEQNKEYNQTWIDNLKQRVHDLECAVYLLQQENKQLKNNQAETKPEPQPETKLEPKPTTKKQPKFKLPENFADYQQECDDLVDELSCFYNIKKGKWEKDILQFILTPVKSTTPPYPNKWKAGLYLQPGEWTWTIDKVSMSDPDEWKEHFMNVYDFVDSSGIEIS